VNIGLYLHVARRWVIFAILPALVAGAAGYVLAKHQPKVYQSSAILYVQQPDPGSLTPGSTDIYTSTAVIPTYAQMITSPVIARAVDRAMSKQYPGYALESHSLSVGGVGTAPNQPTTQLMSITVTDSKPTRAAAGANAAADAFIKINTNIQRSRFHGGEKAIQRQLNAAQANIQIVSQRIASYSGPSGGLNNLKAQLNAYQSIYQTLLASSQEYNVGRDTALNAVKVFSPAQPGGPTGSNPSRQALLYLFAALIVCTGGIFLYDYLDDTPRTPEELEEIVGAPVLGTVQRFESAGLKPGLLSPQDASSHVAEAYRMIRTNLQYIDTDNPVRSILVTSPSPSEGKSTTIANLAQVFADAGRRVLLVDADMRRPVLHQLFQTDRNQGLTNLLVGTDQLNGVGIQGTRQPNLALIAAGPAPPRPADLLTSERMVQLMAHLRRQADVVLVDTPPVLAVTDAAVMSTAVDGVVLVVDTAKTKRRELLRARESIEAVGGRILGMVVNRLDRRGSGYYYYYYQHNYGYQFKYDYGSEQKPASSSR
jgi:polysaccharide biosynthesis transport protein